MSSEIRCKDTTKKWNMQILKYKKLSFLTKIAHFLAYFKYLLYLCTRKGLNTSLHHERKKQANMARKKKLLTKKNVKGIADCFNLIGMAIYYFFKILFYYPLYFVWKGVLLLYHFVLNFINEQKSNKTTPDN